MTDIRVTTPAEDTLGEGPSWDAAGQTLSWVDIKRPSVNRLGPDGGVERWTMPEPVGAAVPTARGDMLVALKSGLARFDPATGSLTRLVAPEPDRPGNRLNDGKCDPRGRFWIGSMDEAEAEPSGHFYRYEAGRPLERLDAGFVVTNGIGWSADGRTMYVTNSTGREIHRLDYDPDTGKASGRRLFATVEEGFPDGLCVDDEDHVWSCHWDGWRVTRYRPDGTVDRTVALPVPRPTSCTFGGKGGATLYVTSARIGLSGRRLADAPLSGAVLAITGLGVTGPASVRFTG